MIGCKISEWVDSHFIIYVDLLEETTRLRNKPLSVEQHLAIIVGTLATACDIVHLIGGNKMYSTCGSPRDMESYSH